MRQVVLDTESTGLEYVQGHRIIEIGCVEIVNRRLTKNTYHQYINPDRDIDAGALEVHGLTEEFLADKPMFEEIADDFLSFIEGAELVIHNAAFDAGFLNHEITMLAAGKGDFESHCSGIIDTLDMARKLHPGQRNSLDALCKRYEIDNSHRQLHGALLDAEILADVYLRMTGGQTDLLLKETSVGANKVRRPRKKAGTDSPLFVQQASQDELNKHQIWLQEINKQTDGACVWLRDDLEPNVH